MSDTPRTDAVERERCETHSHYALLEHSRRLERENAELLAALECVKADYNGCGEILQYTLNKIDDAIAKARKGGQP